MSRTPVPVPTKEQVTTVLEQNSNHLTKAAAAFNVSYPTFRKWAVLYGLTKTPQTTQE